MTRTRFNIGLLGVLCLLIAGACAMIVLEADATGLISNGGKTASRHMLDRRGDPTGFAIHFWFQTGFGVFFGLLGLWLAGIAAFGSNQAVERLLKRVRR